ncbi:MAG TPA: DUF5047 domain-containing protein [Microlunatus sp.]
MIPASSLLQEAVRYSHNRFARVNITHHGIAAPDDPESFDVPVVKGRVTDDRGSGVRRTADLTIGLYPWQNVHVDVYNCRFTIELGFDSIGRTEYVQIGEFRVEEVNRTSNGMLTLTGSGLESYVIDARFIRPRTPSTGISTVAAIQQLITEVVPRAQFQNLSTHDRTVTKTAPWERDRWRALDSLCESIDTELRVSGAGVFVLMNRPDLLNGTPVYIANIGDGGIVMDDTVASTRDKVYNAVAVEGKQDDKVEAFGWAYDSDPDSPTYYYGEFGQVPRFYTSQFLTDSTQCTNTAKSMLAESRAENRQVSFTGASMPFLESGDLITLQLHDGSYENHIVQKTSMVLEATGFTGIDVQTLASKVPVVDTEPDEG